uniref:Retrotransposon gag domain-containing protein n=1 Tax=Cannabis sativa TaxID=3483 RepID=A0A803Q2Y7_CANSA
MQGHNNALHHDLEDLRASINLAFDEQRQQFIEWRDRELETFNAQQVAIDDCRRQATIVIRRAYQVANQQPATAYSIPLGSSKGYGSGHTVQTHNGQLSNPRPQVQPVGQTVDSQILSDRPLGGVIPYNFTPTEISGQTSQMPRPPYTSVFNRLGVVHDLKSYLNKRRGLDEKYVPLAVQPDIRIQFPVQRDPSVTQVGQQDELVHPFVQAQLDQLKNMFSSSCQLPSHLKDLVEVKHMTGEPLRAYISRFTTKATKDKGLIEEGRLAAILGGIGPLGELWKDIKRLIMGSMVEFLDQGDGFIKLKEVVWRVETLEQKKSQLRTTSAGTSVQSPQHPNNSNLNWKRSNNDTQGNKKKGTFVGNVEQHPRDNTSKFTTFSVLIHDLETIYATTQSIVPYKKPSPMKKDVSKRDMSKFRRFHANYDHDTNECNNLKQKIEFLIRKNNPPKQRITRTN